MAHSTTLLLLSVIFVDIGQSDRRTDCESLILNDGGSVLTPNDESYDAVRLNQFASHLSSIQHRNTILSPTLIVIPATAKEIQHTITFANSCGYIVAVRSGGHQYQGFSSCFNSKCIQIVMDNFDYIRYDKDKDDDIKTITVGAGVKLKDLYTTNDANNVTVVGGMCGSVGVGGHFQTSSHSILSRSMGLGMDWVIAIVIVTADGKIQHLHKNTDKQHEKELFWAILGGSPGSWGVILEYQFKAIINSDYPHSALFYYGYLYSKETFEALWRAIVAVLNNPYYYNYHDLSMVWIGFPLLSNLTTSSSMIAVEMVITLTWSGIDNGDINNIIPNHHLNKTWFQEFIQPFIDIGSIYQQFEAPSISLSSLLVNWVSVTKVFWPLPPFRYLVTHTDYTEHQLNTLFDDTMKTEAWITSYVNKMDEIYSSKDNVWVLTNFWTPMRTDGKLGNDIVITRDPLQNAISYPLRDLMITSDNWILFGDGDQYIEDDWLKAKQYRDEIKHILTQSQVVTDLKSFAYTGLTADQYDLNLQFNQFYNYRQDIYRKLQNIKTRVDHKNIFRGALTIPPHNMLVAADNAVLYLIMFLLIINVCLVLYQLLRSVGEHKRSKVDWD